MNKQKDPENLANKQNDATGGRRADRRGMRQAEKIRPLCANNMQQHMMIITSAPGGPDGLDSIPQVKSRL